MQTPSDKYAWSIAIAGGAVLWLAATVFGGRGEAWDSPLYWSVAYPLSLALSAGLGYQFPRKPWRWPLAVMFSQAVVLAALAASFGLLPLGLILFGILALPGVVLANFAAKLRLRGKGS
ncbi:MAG: hypothetical protein WDZ63_17610 [Burkholderiales bacterium]